MSEYAIIETGSKQYRVEPKSVIEVELIKVPEGKKEVSLDKVLLVSKSKTVQVGTPLVKGAKVETTVTGQIKGPKLLVFKYKPRVHYRKRQGHRQQYTLLQVDKIVTKSGEKKDGA